MTTVVGYRVADWDTPLWANPNRSQSRFSLAGAAVQYWSLHPLTPWAEYLRGLNLRDPDDAVEIRLRPWAAELEVADDIVDLTFANAAVHGLEARDLVDDNWRRCQDWVATVRPPGLFVPSAALPGTTNVILFGERVRSRYGVGPLQPDIDVPCDPVADSGVVPLGLLPHVRWRGSTHAGLEAWRRGDDQPLPPPDPTGWRCGLSISADLTTPAPSHRSCRWLRSLTASSRWPSSPSARTDADRRRSHDRWPCAPASAPVMSSKHRSPASALRNNCIAEG